MQLNTAHLTSQDDVIPGGMQGHAGEAARSSDEPFRKLLLGKVVDADIVLGGNEQEGLDGMEQDPHYPPPIFPEWVLGGLL